MATLQQEAKAWYRKRNANQKAVDWQFTTEDARVKLKRLYPQIQMLCYAIFQRISSANGRGLLR